MFPLGLTGGIGVGKSVVLTYFNKLGWNILNADSICHNIYDNSKDMRERLIDHWGTSILNLDSSLNRKKISDIVFNEPVELKWLNVQLHPEIFKRASDFISALPEKSKVIFEVPLMYEVAWDNYFEKIIVVYAADDIRKQRLIERGMNIQNIELRFNAQMVLDKKLELADYALINNGSLELLEKQILALELHL